MKRVFLDANVFLNALLQRTVSFADDERLLVEAAQRTISLYTSSSLLLTMVYFLKKDGQAAEAIINTTDKLLNIVTVVSPTEKTFRQGLYSGFPDLEDGIQYHTALQVAGLDCFITNNKKDFKKAYATLPVLTPKEFFAL